MDSACQIATWLRASCHAVVFTGAGISTESGIPDFRSPGGIWSQAQPVYFDDFLASAPARHEYWRQKSIAHRDFAASQPNGGHRCLARWQAAGLLHETITQNIDGLHQLAGSRDVIELHGTARQVACLDCGARFDASELVAQFLQDNAVPPCPQCTTGLLKHATISFGQSLDPEVLERAFDTARRADLMLVLGSSLVVEPAASLPRVTRSAGGRLVILNRDPTPLDSVAAMVVHAPLGAALEAIDRALTAET